ncbi:MAG: AMP-binding protein [Myxococcales bacterium]|nr:AMP-binding protein [Myxococcales bacterium]
MTLPRPHDALSIALSISAAAAQHPTRLALITRTARLTFADAAAKVAELLDRAPAPASSPTASASPLHAAPLSAERTPGTVLQLWAALEAGRPLGLLHPQQSARARQLAQDALTAHPVPADAAVVLFTSGTTGSPRGVVHRRASLLAAASAHAQRLPWRDDDLTLVTLSLAAAGGLAALVRSLVARRPVALVEEHERWPLPQALAESCATQVSLVPAQLWDLLSDERFTAPPALRAILLGGAPCPAVLRARAWQRGVPLLVTYGMTETLGQVATAHLDVAPDSDATAIGPPLPGITVRAGTQDAPAQIEIEGPTCMAGYLGEPLLPAPRLVTRDLGWLDARGVLHVLGRADELIITGGHKVSPQLLEDELRATAGVLDACVFAVPDDRWGHVVAAALVTAEDFDLPRAAALWRRHLPAHQRPRQVVLLARLPRNANGKVDRAAVAQAAPRLAVPYPR